MLAAICFLGSVQSLVCLHRRLKWERISPPLIALKGKTPTCQIDDDDSNDAFVHSAPSTTVLGFKIFALEYITRLPENLVEVFPNITDYEAILTKITTVKRKLFQGLNELVFVNLMENQIETVTADAFADCTKLEFLYLNSNEIKVLAPNHFQAQPNLRYLSLEDNEIVVFPKDLFAANTKLEEIEVGNNRLRVIDADVFDHLVAWKLIGLSSNYCIDRSFSSQNSSDTLAALKTLLTADCSEHHD